MGAIIDAYRTQLTETYSCCSRNFHAQVNAQMRLIEAVARSGGGGGISNMMDPGQIRGRGYRLPERRFVILLQQTVPSVRYVH